MSDVLKKCSTFMHEQLIPEAINSLMHHYGNYCRGDNLDAELKQDGTPASRADKDTEMLLRNMISDAFPLHGIAGEEFGNERCSAELVWVLDPLDGTKEFLSQKAGWGILIALLHNGLPVLGSIVDPQKGKIWDQDLQVKKSIYAKRNAYGEDVIEKLTISTTAPDLMFAGTQYEAGFNLLRRTCASMQEGLNCLGFAYVADGTIDVALENKLKIHDIAALLPALWAAGVKCSNLSGQDYRGISFDIENAASERYGMIASRDENVIAKIIDILKGGKQNAVA